MCGDLGDQALAEFVPMKGALLVEADRHAERATLPWCIEDELAILARYRGRAAKLVDGGIDGHRQLPADGRATPIIVSRVTSLTRSSSLNVSVPVGRSGNTR